MASIAAKATTAVVFTAGLLLTAPVIAADVPAGYPASYKAILDAAVKEGKVTVYSTTDAAQAAALV
jgi:iron(III) transport system substrate-binding protein